VIYGLLVAYMAFALLTWLADPLFNLLLRFSRFGRLAFPATSGMRPRGWG